MEIFLALPKLGVYVAKRKAQEEKFSDSVIRSQVDINSMQFGFMPVWGTTDAIFILCQLQEKHLGKHKPLYFAFVDIEKAFDRVPRKALWWAIRRVGVEEWVIRAVKATCENAKSRVRANGQFNDEFNIKVGVHQGSTSRCCSESSSPQVSPPLSSEEKIKNQRKIKGRSIFQV